MRPVPITDDQLAQTVTTAAAVLTAIESLANAIARGTAVGGNASAGEAIANAGQALDSIVRAMEFYQKQRS